MTVRSGVGTSHPPPQVRIITMAEKSTGLRKLLFKLGREACQTNRTQKILEVKIVPVECTNILCLSCFKSIRYVKQTFPDG